MRDETDVRLIRLDVCVAACTGYSRSFARELITGGRVSACGKTLTKPGQKVPVGCVPDIAVPDEVFVGRGGYKLRFALEQFGISLAGRICADIGAATGGFTDCMLRRGAAMVYAIDNGCGQLAEKLRNDPRVVSIEGTNVNEVLEKGQGSGLLDGLVNKMDFVAVDVSFVSLAKVINAVVMLMRGDAVPCSAAVPYGCAVLLVKPQFEAGPGVVGRSGIVRDRRIRERAVENAKVTVGEAGLRVLGIAPSPVLGGDGNQEYLMYAVLK